ncbi:MAG TPA: ABC transporter ATP-binding protein [Gemmatales bacterium]|nr:ABC transporter ATP-binding protein [Gemmatales bacterium]
MSPPAIELQNLCIRYGSFEAVHDLSFTVREGEIFGLLGPNGAGKTTTFHCLTRQVPLSSGTVKLLGKDISTENDQIKPYCGYVPDTENHFDDFTPFQNLQIYARLYNIDQARIDTCLELVELQRARNLPVKTYSKGMKKKLLLARELLHQPRLLLLDEPTANLDVHSTDRFRHLSPNLARQGTTVLITTHNMGEVEQVCERVAIINHGKLIDLDSPTAFKTRHTERMVDIVLEYPSGWVRKSLPLHDASARAELAQLLQAEIPVTLHTREFNFYQAFLQLTGEKYN